MTGMDYRKFYNLELYLFGEVHLAFKLTGRLEPIQFFAILVWKANRAKEKHLKRLQLDGLSFPEVVKKISEDIHTASNHSDRLNALMQKWGFRLPTATAVLSVLYPEEFTVYDVRVCDMLGDYHKLAHRKYSQRLWEDYLQFIKAVNASVRPEFGPTLRDRDRYLWGKSWYKDAIRR